MSSGGICAFTVAWQRPDCFHKVMSHVGSFCDIRGGHNYPFYIREWARRELQALEFRKYDHLFVGGKGGHDGNHGRALLPDSMRWLWRH
ncbi:MAG: hypothetical protein RL685_4979 [Pseudomonadota bacterium]|jgi:enterochelin esterase family protein